MRARVLAGLLLGVGGGTACDDGPRVVQAGEGRVVVDPPIVDLGAVYVGQIARADLRVRSVGEVPVAYAARFIGPAAGFVYYGAEERLPAGREVERPVFYVPRRPGPRRTTLELVPQDASSPPARVEILAEGRAVPDCEDGNGCTIDRFDFDAGICRHEAARLPCDDFNACTENDFCVDGVCLGEGTSCDDGDVCTDDLCDPQQGCVHTLLATCDDGNPCTADTCDPRSGCRNETLDDGTPCDDFEVCTEGDICLGGQCRGIQVPEGTRCDDGDPCSIDDRCIDGTCRDPSYTPPGPGDVKFVTELGPLAPGSPENPLVGPAGVVFTGVTDGVAAIDACGVPVWTSTVGAPRFEAAVALPSLVSVPVGLTIVDLDQATGAPIGAVDLRDHVPPAPNGAEVTGTRILDVAARASGALIVSVERLVDGAREGYLLELDAPHETVTLFASLGPSPARRIAIDRDESLVLLLRAGDPDRGVAAERLIRLGIDGLAGGSWSTSPIETARSDLALGAASQVLWTAGLTRVSRDGLLRTLAPLPPSGPERIGGSPILLGPWVWSQERTMSGGALTARTSTGGIQRRLPIARPALAASPVVDRLGNVFVLDQDAVLRGFDADGGPLFATELDPQTPVEEAALTLSEDALLIAVIGDRVYGVQGYAGLARSPWPRHRRDNFGTSHR